MSCTLDVENMTRECIQFSCSRDRSTPEKIVQEYCKALCMLNNHLRELPQNILDSLLKNTFNLSRRINKYSKQLGWVQASSFHLYIFHVFANIRLMSTQNNIHEFSATLSLIEHCQTRAIRYCYFEKFSRSKLSL